MLVFPTFRQSKIPHAPSFRAFKVAILVFCTGAQYAAAGASPVSMVKHETQDTDGAVLHSLTITAAHAATRLNSIVVNGGTCGTFTNGDQLDARDLNLTFPYPMRAKEVISWVPNCDATKVLVNTDSGTFVFNFEK